VGLAHDLQRQARHLATYEGSTPSQAALRRAVSTAYYALFHLLIEDAAQRWEGSTAAATGLERAFNHGPMKNSSTQFKNSSWRDSHGVLHTVPPALQRVAQVFIDLQNERQTADYNNYVQWTITDVQPILDTVESAFEDWQSIRTNPMAGNYLLAMLLGKQR